VREIKFRGKRIDNGEWVCGCLYYFNYESNPANPVRAFISPINEIAYKDGDVVEEWEVDPETVGQFTNSRDSKRTAKYPQGQEIYEDDIIRVEELHFDTSGSLPDILNVKFYDGTFQLFRGKQCLMGLHLSYVKNGEVIGRIFDNPDFLETVE
jgi:uncharacterized phage protein (TIGR01671 family)